MIIVSVILVNTITMTQVNLKINNLNIEDIFDWQRMERLKKVFQNNLWQESHQVRIVFELSECGDGDDEDDDDKIGGCTQLKYFSNIKSSQS